MWARVLRACDMDVHAIQLQPAARGLADTQLHDYCLQVDEAVRSLPQPRVLVGASLGGLLAMMCADVAEALVLVNPIPPQPWHAHLPRREWAPVVDWNSSARLEATGRSIGSGDEASALFAFRRWRDESGAVLREACAGVAVVTPACPTLVMLSNDDQDVPPALVVALATAWNAGTVRTGDNSHLGPLLGANATSSAEQAVAWLNRVAPRSRNSDLVGTVGPQDAPASFRRPEIPI